MPSPDKTQRPRLLIEDWLPIAEIGLESIRERTPMTPYPAPNRIHVWWARRPLVASRAAILASLLPADADREMFLHILGIHGDPVGARKAIDQAVRNGERIQNPYDYDRAFKYSPSSGDLNWIEDRSSFLSDSTHQTVLDPTAGGGSIPFEAIRLGLDSVANELNPVAWLLLKCTIEFPVRFGNSLLDRYTQLAKIWRRRMEDEVGRFFPRPTESNREEGTYLWSRTVTCPYCNGLVPLSPNWRLDGKGKGVRLVPHTENPDHRYCTFEIVEKLKEQSPGTVKGGNGLCPYPDCGRGIHGDEIKAQAQAGKMGRQLYTIVYKETKVVGYTKTGKPKVKKIRGFRAPRPEDDVEEQVRKALEAKMPEWQARNIVPDEEYPANTNDDRPRQYGMPLWRDMFAPRQLYGHCVSVEVFQDMVEELRQKNGELSELDKAAMAYIAIAIDKMLNYNSILSRWDQSTGRIRSKFDRHDYAFLWSYGEMAPTITGLGYDWALRSGEEALEELIKLLNGGPAFQLLDETEQSNGKIQIRLGSADALDLEDKSVDCIVMDPPYYGNVMYAELADFFYVWLKRTAGLLYPEAFVDYLTDKDREAVANPAKFKGKRKAKDLAGEDYQRRMAAIFRECRRVLKPHGVMTLMFTHKASGAWDAVARGLVEAGFVITASWPVNTEAEGSMHIREKSAAKSTIFLVCRVRETRPEDSDTVYWEDIEPKVAEAVRRRIAEFQNAGIRGVDLYLASFGPALQVFSEAWPIQRGRAVQRSSDLLYEEFDPYSVSPEDALDAARREVKQWRMDQLATMKRQHHLDPVTEWFILAWDAFRAPRFPADEALKLARVVGTDFDSDIKNRFCEVKGSDAILWDSSLRKRKGRLGPVGGAVMLDTLHRAAALGIEQNTGAAKELIEQAGLVDDATFLTALEALLNVLPPGGSMAKGKLEDVPLAGASNDFEALEKLRRLAFTEKVPAPQQALLF